MIDAPDLNERIRAGDSAALRAVIEAYLPQILRAARGTGLDESRAEDVAQATFVTFIEKAPTFEGRSHVRTWLFGILYRKIAGSRRQAETELRHDPIEDQVEQRFTPSGDWAQPPRTGEAVLHAAALRQQIEDCLEPLSPGQRMAFALREIDGFSTPDICKILDVTRTNLGVLLYRGRNRLRECLEGKGVFGSGDAEL